MRILRGILTGGIIGIVVAVFVTLWLHAIPEAAAGMGGVVGISVALVVGTRPDARDEAADAAWREAATDLPPASDRAAMEAAQATMPAPAPGSDPVSSVAVSTGGELQDPGAGIGA